MRLKKVATGHPPLTKLKLARFRLEIRDEPPDVVKALWYRPSLFGKPFGKWLQGILRGPSQWTVGERELFAAFTSRLNQCVF